MRYFLGFMILCLTPLVFATRWVEMKTNQGDMILALDENAAPETVENFMHYVKDGFYDGTVFHRVIPNFMIQGGGYTADLQQKPTRGPIASESQNGLKNVRGTIAMARTSDPHSATSQFFINVVDNPFLDQGTAPDKYGYTVFGVVRKGMAVADKIAKLPTAAKGPFQQDVPQQPVIITSVREIEAPADLVKNKANSDKGASTRAVVGD